MDNKTKIVCTIGPACADKEILKQMMLAGMNVARFNMSHGTHESHRQLMDLVKQARFELGLPVAIMLDTKGPEIRVRQFSKGKIVLKEGAQFALTTENLLGDESIVSVTYNGLPDIVTNGTKILLNDGLVELRVESKTKTIIHTRVIVGGELSNNKSINIPSVELNMEYLSDIDKSDLEFGITEQVDVYSISFVNHAKDVEDVRAFLKSKGEEDAFIISKIESAKGIENLEEIIDASNGIMVARGDLGVEIDFEKLPYLQKVMINMAKAKGKYTITATQMLESMITNSRPTRAEISDVANAIYDGTSAIMLSGETSAGKHPVLAVSTMQKIANETEKNIDYTNEVTHFPKTNDITCGVGYAACALAASLNAQAILVTTNSGKSASDISRFRPACKIIALSPNFNVYCKLGMFWGIVPLLDKTYYDTDSLLKGSRERALIANVVRKDDLVVQATGLITGFSGSNMLVVSHIED